MQKLLGIMKMKSSIKMPKTFSKSYVKKDTVGVIANQSAGTEKRLESCGLMKYIQLVVASAEEGVAKPDKRIFDIALKRAGCSPSEAVMIGDRVDNDIISAKEMGMMTIWVRQGFGKYWTISDKSEKADFTVDNLSELLDIFR